MNITVMHKRKCNFNTLKIFKNKNSEFQKAITVNTQFLLICIFFP